MDHCVAIRMLWGIVGSRQLRSFLVGSQKSGGKNILNYSNCSSYFQQKLEHYRSYFPSIGGMNHFAKFMVEHDEFFVKKKTCIVKSGSLTIPVCVIIEVTPVSHLMPICYPKMGLSTSPLQC